MAKAFPLYDYLLVVAQKDGVNMELSTLAAQLGILRVEHSEIIQALIVHHNKLKGGHENVPFNGALLTKTSGVQYNLAKFPLDLQGILSAYLHQLPQ